MHRIDEAGATVDNRFQTGNPSLGQPATRIGADWPNAIQEEIMSVLEAAGIDPAKGTNTQLRDAIVALIAGGGEDLSAYLRKDGGTMTGALTLAGAPDSDLKAATKKYVDDLIAALAATIPSLAGYLPLAGGTMTGALILAADPDSALKAATKQYVDARTDGAWVENWTADADHTATAIPKDDTVPQNNEGKQFGTINVTIVAGQKVELDVQAHLMANDQECCIALFRSGSANALATAYASGAGGATQIRTCSLTFVDAPGAGAHTYTVRFGPLGAGDAWLNSQNTTPDRLHGGVAKSGLRGRPIRGS